MSIDLRPLAHAIVHVVKRNPYQFSVGMQSPHIDAPLALYCRAHHSDEAPVFKIGGRKLVKALVAGHHLPPISKGLGKTIQHINEDILPVIELKLRVAVPPRILAKRHNHLSLRLTPERMAQKLKVPLAVHWQGGRWKAAKWLTLDQILVPPELDQALEAYRDLQDHS